MSVLPTAAAVTAMLAAAAWGDPQLPVPATVASDNPVWPTIAITTEGATAGRVVRVARTEDTVDSVAAGGNRVFWASWGVDASVHAAGLTTSSRRLLRVGGLGGYDYVSPSIWASQRRVAAQVEGHWSGPDDEGVNMLAQATSAIGAPGMRQFESPAGTSYERVQDVAGDELLSIGVKRVRGRWTVRAYVRADGAPRPVGPRLRLARGETSDTVEGRLSARWMALLRQRAVTVYDRSTGLPAWRARLSAPAGSWGVWDLGEDGTLAVAGVRVKPGTKRESAALGFMNEGRYRRVSSAVVPRQPFVLRAGVLTYLRPARGGRARLYARWRGGPPRHLTGDLPSGPLASDGALVVAAVDRARGPVRCILGAALPVPATARCRCP